MRFRLFKSGFKRARRRQFFAWLPKRMQNGTIVWLERVNRYPHDTYNDSFPKAREIDAEDAES